jgi:hypothetical protein
MKDTKYFFSYSRNDFDFVQKLATELRAAGASLWLDGLDIVGGQRWDRAIEESLRDCKGMIVVLSPASVASDNVMDEVSYALEEQKIVIPVLYRDCTLPFRLRRLQYIDFTKDYKDGFMQLLKALGIGTPSESEEASGNKTPHISSNFASAATKEAPVPTKGGSIKFKYIIFIYIVCLLWGSYIALVDKAPEKILNLFLLATVLSVVYVIVAYIVTRIIRVPKKHTN